MTPIQYDAIRQKARENIAAKEGNKPEQLREFDSVDALMEAVQAKEPREAL